MEKMNRAIKNRAVSDGRGTAKAVPHDPPARGGSVTYECKGFKVVILGKYGCYMGAINTKDGTFFVTHCDGSYFKHRPSVRSTVKTVIRWHLKHGGWKLPRDAKFPTE